MYEDLNYIASEAIICMENVQERTCIELGNMPRM